MFNISIEIKENRVEDAQVEFNLKEWLEVLANNEFFNSQPKISEALNSDEFKRQQAPVIQGYFLKLLGGSTTRNFERLFEGLLNDSSRELLERLYDELDILRDLACARYVPMRGFRSF